MEKILYGKRGGIPSIITIIICTTVFFTIAFTILSELNEVMIEESLNNTMMNNTMVIPLPDDIVDFMPVIIIIAVVAIILGTITSAFSRSGLLGPDYKVEDEDDDEEDEADYSDKHIYNRRLKVKEKISGNVGTPQRRKNL